MTKSEMVARIAEKSQISKVAAGKAMETFISTIGKELKKNGRLTLVGLGTFKVVARKARTGRNPQTGASIKIKAGKSVKFKAGKALKESV